MEQERVTTETYFNGKAEPDADTVALVESSLRRLADANDVDEAGDDGSSDEGAADTEVAVVSMG